MFQRHRRRRFSPQAVTSSLSIDTCTHNITGVYIHFGPIHFGPHDQNGQDRSGYGANCMGARRRRPRLLGISRSLGRRRPWRWALRFAGMEGARVGGSWPPYGQRWWLRWSSFVWWWVPNSASGICFNFCFYIVRARNCMYVNVYWPRVSGSQPALRWP